MMSLNVNVPQIAITPEAEEDDDNNFLNLTEALTDIEELLDETISTKNHCYRKKLKIKVSDNDGYNTALEDIEASDDEDTTIIKQHEFPFALDDLDMEQYSAEENCGIAKISDSQYLNTQSSALRPRRASESFNNFLALTDVEDYDTENDEEDEGIPDTEIHSDGGESIQTVKISDEIQDKNLLISHEAYSSECATPHTSTNFPISLFEAANVEPPRKKPPTFSQIMKAKSRSTDHKMRRRRKNKPRFCKLNDTKDSEESESSETELKLTRTKKQISTMNSLNFESDHEEENKLSFPVCKKTFTRNKNFLHMPEFDINNITDVEDVECDVDISRRRVSVDSNIFQKQLDEMASCYSFTKDKNEGKEKQNEALSNDKTKQNEVSKSENEKPSHKLKENNLLLPTLEEAGATDVENIGSSTENDETDVEDEQNLSSGTEEESFKDNEFINVIDLPEIPLPPATRLLVIAEESKSLIPTMRILPLDESILTDSETENISTEDECFDSVGEVHENEEPRTLHSPFIPVFDGGSINMSEDCIHSPHSKANIEEEVTDIEDLEADVPKHKKERRGKITGKYLTPNNIVYSQQTDDEDLDMSDDKSAVSLMLISSDIEGHTDVEALESSEEEGDKSKSTKSKKPTIQTLAAPLLILPGCTDTEEVVASTDDEISYSRADTATPRELRKELDQASSVQVTIENSSKIDYSCPEEVMYLKGGGFQESITDTEELLDDAALQFQSAMEAWEYFNYIDGDTTSKPSGSRDTMKDQSQESSVEKKDGQVRQPPVDQHQLSDEMKELLKEMEKDSKK